jgi:EAL domain-containing protein (putative c-di-GMP-specific phosphodiesterase class I)
LVDQAELLAEVDLATTERLALELSRLDRLSRRVERVWLNISAGELFVENFVETVAAMAQRSGLVGRFGIDVPDFVFSVGETPASRRLALARRLGIAVAIDNFGRELRLRQLDTDVFDTIKVDRSLVGRVDEGSVPRSVVAAVVELGHRSGATVVAEGVERLSQLEALRDLGCDGAQGYLFGRPVQAMELLGANEPELPPCTWWG